MTVRFWKPYGVLPQFTDPDGRPTLADFGLPPNVYAAGRLDMDSEGLLLLTDDGMLNKRLTNKAYETDKTYWVQVDGQPTQDALENLQRGVTLKDGPARAISVRLLEDPPELPDRTPPIRVRKEIPAPWIEIVVDEGRNRMVRRMTAAIGHPTLRLVRVAIGPYTLDGLKPGEWAIAEAWAPTPSSDRRSGRAGSDGPGNAPGLDRLPSDGGTASRRGSVRSPRRR